MFYDKKTKIKKYSTKTIDIFDSFKKNTCNNYDEFLIKDDLGEMSYNLICKDGSLKDNFGFKELSIHVEGTYVKQLTYTGDIYFKKVWRYKYYSENNSRYEYILLMYASDNKVYYNNLFGYSPVLYPVGNFTFDEIPKLLFFTISGSDCVGFATSTNNLVVWNCDGNPYEVTTTPKFKDICLHNNKLFAIENGKNSIVRFSTTTNVAEWTITNDINGGQINLGEYRGELNRIISYLDNIYVFRDFGISKIASYSSSSVSFSVSNVFNSSYKIYPNSVSVCGEDIYFLCEDGLYVFDGYKVEKIDIDIMNNFKKYNQENACICFYNGKIYISCYINFASNEQVINNCIIEYDIDPKKYNLIKGVSVLDMYALKDKDLSCLVFCLNDINYKTKLWQNCLGQDSTITLPKYWKSGKFVVTNERSKKILKEINIKTLKNITLTITTEQESRTFNITADSDIQKINIGLVGKQFEIEISKSSGEFDISFFKMLFSY